MATAKKITLAKKSVTAPVKAPRKQARSAVAKAPARKSGAAKKAAAPVALPPQPAKAAKTKKPKLVRDSFTIPKAEYSVLEELKQRATQMARPVKKSELLRAGIKALAAMTDTAFLAALASVPAIKTGRPTLEG